jgi:hypothetical protein
VDLIAGDSSRLMQLVSGAVREWVSVSVSE